MLALLRLWMGHSRVVGWAVRGYLAGSVRPGNRIKNYGRILDMITLRFYHRFRFRLS
jgi:hypothetical protein